MKKAVKIGLAGVLGIGLGIAGYTLLPDSGPTAEVVYNFPLSAESADVEESILLDGSSAYDDFVQVAEDREMALDVDWYDFDDKPGAESAFIGGVNGLYATSDWTQWWQFSVNNEIAPFGVSAYVPVEGDVISLDYKDGVELDALEWLVDNQKRNGALGDTFFQHSFGLIGLSLHDGKEVDKATERAIRYTRRAQQEDASFRSDDLYTAVATMSLLSNGLTGEDFAKEGSTSIDLLLAHQRADGGWRSGSGVSDVSTTSWVIMAIAQAGYEVPETAVEYLLEAQQENGAWGYTAESSSVGYQYTQEALLALAAADYPRDGRIESALEWLNAAQGPEGCYADGFLTALGSMVLDAWKGDSPRTLACLSTLQKGDGSFGRGTNPSNAMDTGLALWAMGKD